MSTWKVKKWENKPKETKTISFECPHCGTDAELECGFHHGALMLAIIGMGIIFEPANFKPQPGFLPQIIQCRKCRNVFSDEEMEANDVR